MTDRIYFRQENLYGLLCIVSFICYYSLHSLDLIYLKGVLLFGIGMGFLNILNLNRLSQRKRILLVGIGLFFLFRLIVDADIRTISIYLVILAGMYIDWDSLFVWMFWSKLFSFIIGMVSGIYKNNACALHGGMLLLIYLCMHRKEMKNRHVLKAALASGVIFLYTGTGAFLVGMGVAFLCLIYRYMLKRTHLLEGRLAEYVFPLALFANVFCVLGMVEKQVPFLGRFLPGIVNTVFMKVVDIVNIATSSRIALAASAWPTFGFSLLGGNIDYDLLNLDEGVYFYLDSGMLWLLQGFGLIIAFIFMALMVYLMKYLVEQKEYIIIIAGIVIALWAINEDMLLTVDTNFLLALIGTAFIDRKDKEYITI